MTFFKCFKTLLLLSPLFVLFAACKKEDREPAIAAAHLSPGRAAIKFTASKAFNGDREFNINNTRNTMASNQPLGGSTARTIKLEATDLYESNAPSRKATIDLAVRTNAPAAIDLTKTNGLPLGKITLESYSLLGIMRYSQSGTITLTRLTDTEIEGSFTATFDDGTVINNGQFAGKF